MESQRGAAGARRGPWIGRAAVRLVGLGLAATVSAACSRTNENGRFRLEVSEVLVRIEARAGEVVAPIEIAVDSLDRDGVHFGAQSRAPWLRVDPKQSRTPAVLRLSVQTFGLAPGTYRGAVGLVGPELDDTPPIVVVELLLSAPGWTALAGPYGGSLSCVAVDPDDSDRILAGGMTGGVYLSSDGGASFVTVPTSFGAKRVFAVALAAGGVGYAGVEDGGVYRSDDGGLSWSPTALGGVDVTSLAVAPQDPQLVLALAGQLLWSDNGGADWSAVTQPTTGVVVLVDPTGTAPFAIGGADGQLWRGDGQSFTALDTGDPSAITGFATVASGRWFLARYPRPLANAPTLQSSDAAGAGGTWTTRETGLPVTQDVRFLLRGAADAVWVLSAAGAYVSRDGGGLFQRVLPSFHAANDLSEVIADLAFHPDGPLLASAADGVLRAGAAGGLSRLGMFGHSIFDLEVHPGTGDLWVVTSAKTLFRYTPQEGFVGAWGLGFAANPYGYLVNVGLDPRSPDSVLAASVAGGIGRTTDGGRTWTVQPIAGTLGVEDVARVPGDPDVIWTCDDSADPAVFRSLDGGVTWDSYNLAEASQVVPISRDVVLTGDENGVYRVDATTGVVTPITPNGAFAAATGDGSLWYSGASVGLHRSRDGGVTWEDLGVAGGDTFGLAVDPADATHVYLAIGGNLEISHDEGGNWSDAGAPFFVTALAIDPRSGTLYVGTDGGGVYRYAEP